MGKTAMKLLEMKDEEFYEGMGVYFVALATDLGEDGDETARDEGRGVLRGDGSLLRSPCYGSWVRLDAPKCGKKVQGLLRQPGQPARLPQVHLPKNEGTLLFHRR